MTFRAELMPPEAGAGWAHCWLCGKWFKRIVSTDTRETCRSNECLPRAKLILGIGRPALRSVPFEQESLF